MSNNVFPSLSSLSWSVVKMPRWSTKIQTAASGKELRSSFFSYPIYDLILTYEVLRAKASLQELQTLMGFFNARQGAFDSFLWSDPTDNAVSGQLFGTGDGVKTVFSLCRTYGTNIEPVMNVAGTLGISGTAPIIYLNGTPTIAYSINSTGDVTFSAAPGVGVSITWTGSYYYRCRFVKDSLEFENFMYQLWSLKKCELTGCLGTKI